MGEINMPDKDEKMKQAAEVVHSFTRVSQMLMKFTQQNAAALGLTVAQMGILNTISLKPGITLKEVTEKLLLPKSSVSVAVDDLVNSGLVERRSSAGDRREINLSATEQGMKLFKKSCASPLSYIAMSHALERIPEADIQSLLRLHGELLSHLAQYELQK
jgi:MarR family transcriptional regulator, organic hydroperoxide resistance regulator